MKKAVTIASISIVLIIFSIIFSILNMGYEKIHNNISVQGIDVSGLTKQEAEEKVKKIYREKYLNGINLRQGDFEITISYEQLGVEENISKKVEEAYSVGRSGNIITNNYAILFSKFVKRNIKVDFEINQKSLELAMTDIETKLPNVLIEGSYYIEDNDLIISKGKDGVEIEKENLKNSIVSAIENLKDEAKGIEIPVQAKSPKEINIEKIAEEITKEPQDAYLSKDPLEVHADQDGVELDMSVDDIKKALEEPKEEYIIPLKITKASKTVTDLGEDAFPNKLSTYTTNYDSSNTNRDNNIKLAAQKLNGCIVNPGEEFSYNKTVGKRTIDAGFKEAKAYAGGKVVLDVGGGICQLSSTLYNTVLLANLNVTDRHNHYFQTSYVPAGRDATVSWGSLDFKFKNNRKYPVKIVANAGDGVVTVDIYGIKQDDDQTVIIESNVTNIIESQVEYQNDYTLEKGSEATSQNGSDGCMSETYKTVLKNGVTVSKTLISQDTYNALPTIIKRNQ